MTALLLSWAAFPTVAQQTNPRPVPAPPYQAVDAKMQQVPDSSARTVGGLVRFINASFTTEPDKARAAFVWVARNIRYDVENMYVLEFEREPAVVVQETLAKRAGVCRHYAELYTAIANGVGVTTHTVPGYISLRSATGHAWNASRIEGKWYLMDPTWAAGQVVNDKFVFRLSNEYYKVAPSVFIESHMPFDPLWQLLKAPRTPQQFQLGQTPPASTAAFAFLDSVALYERQTPLQQLHATNRRVEQNGVKNGVIFSYLATNRTREENYHVGVYNEALASFNKGVHRLNAFVEFFNHQFMPRQSDAELKLLLPPIEADFTRARALLTSVQGKDVTQQTSISEFETSLLEAETKLRNSQAFMTRYLATGKLMRPVLFMNISNLSGGNEMMR
ncbi:transglutaminase domain-containing protein [Hymenobacter cellulosivorans]|uniref:Transglutaminase-like domain-containing protein n=1 Tax=Hymenobacter cellulosivorans TaxID=2932249 RepID=A0ABY4FBD1_9BACT|nr:transglutaminase domain-containing protein [Hymenobacter cellulosivorans]UOQ53835.1 hypothetical protein MUN80_03515 [Hymenobacter cellulosivorans]